MNWSFVHSVWALVWHPRKPTLGVQTLCMALLLLATAVSPARADCPAAPIGDPDDMAISFLAANGVQASSASLLASSVREGTLVYDDTANKLKICDGANWIAVGSGSSTDTLASLSCAAGEIAKYDGSAWSCAADGGGSAGTIQSAVQTTDPLTLGDGVITDIVTMAVNTSGTYTIMASGYTNAAAPWLYLSSNCFLVVNGTTVHTSPFYYGAHDASTGSSPFFPHVLYSTSVLTAGQTVKVQCNSTSNSATRTANKWRIDLVPVGGGGSDTLSTLSCATNEIPKWNGSAWTCAAEGGGGPATTYVSAYHTATQQTLTSTASKLINWNEESDAGNNFSTGTFTAPNAGYYAVYGGIGSENHAANEYIEAQIRKNGGSVSLSRDSSTAAWNDPYTNVTWYGYLAAGDTIELWGRTYSTSAPTYATKLQVVSIGGGGSSGGGSITPAFSVNKGSNTQVAAGGSAVTILS